MHVTSAATGTVRVIGPDDAGRPGSHASGTRIRVTIAADDRNSRRVVESLAALHGADIEVEVRDAREDPVAADFLGQLVCCGPVTPVVEVRGLLLTAPTPAEALLAVRRVVGDLRGAAAGSPPR